MLLRLFAGVHYLVLNGDVETLPRDWPELEEIILAHRPWLSRWLAEQPVQTNEVQRCWGLVPCFLHLARASELPLDLIELGSSAGLNLLWDRYAYRYTAGSWGHRDSLLRLGGEERRPVPEALLCTAVDVRRRIGVDRRPVDVRSEDGRRLLEAFVWPEGADRRERLRRAVEIAAADPPDLLEGDYVELLPRLLGERAPGALTVVYQTASLAYLSDEARECLVDVIHDAGVAGPLAWLTAENDEDRNGWALTLTRWPGGEPSTLAYLAYHGQWLEWLG